MSDTTDGITVAPAAGGVEVRIEREFDAPRELVFRAWTEADHFRRWFGPHGATLPDCRIDARPGGTLHYRHRFPDHEDVWIAGVFDEVVAPERLSWTTWFSDASGGRRARPGFPAEMRITVAFADSGAGTRVTIRHTGLAADQGEVQGWRESLDRLRSHLASPAPAAA